MAKRMKREDCLTLSEVIDKSYGGHACGTIYAVINCGAAISIMAGQIAALVKEEQPAAQIIREMFAQA